jgi:hypothetical protein
MLLLYGHRLMTQSLKRNASVIIGTFGGMGSMESRMTRVFESNSEKDEIEGVD